MAIHKDTYHCQKCGQRFTWCYTGRGGDSSARWSPPSLTEDCVELSGIMTVAEEIYEVFVACPQCGAMNEFNCKIPGTLPSLRKL